MVSTLTKDSSKSLPRRGVQWIRLRPWLAVALLLGLYFVLGLSASRDKSPAFDETTHLTAGYNIWLNGDFRFDPANGDFVKRWSALPLLLSRPAFPSSNDPMWRQGEPFVVGYKFLFESGNSVPELLLQARAMVALLGVALGLLVYWSARSLFGSACGLLALGLYAFCPHMLAHGTLVSTDLALTLALFASTWFLWRLLQGVTWVRLVLSVGAFGVLLLSKLSALLILPIAAILVVVRLGDAQPLVWTLGRERRLVGRGAIAAVFAGLIVIHALCGWATIWAGYNFKYLARANPADPGQVFESKPPEARPVTGAPAAVLEFCRRWRLLPEGYLKGAEGLLSISETRPAFMAGHWKLGGFRMFFPYAMLVKTPLPFFLLLPLGVAGWWWTKRRAGLAGAASAGPPVPKLYDLTPLLALIAVYSGAALLQNVNIGHRHILPLYPPFYVLASSAGLWFAGRTPGAKVAAGLTVLCLLWFAGESLRVRPHYLAYFNQIVGGPAKGYLHLVDSSLDWGMDLPGLERWLAEHNRDDREPVYFAYFGTGDPNYYSIRSRRLPGFFDWRQREAYSLGPGIYAISATLLESVYTERFGPWNKLYERQYQATLKTLMVLESTGNDPARRAALLQKYPPQFWEKQYAAFEALRFSRLCAYLRHRPPDDQVGYSILLWRLDEASIAAAMQGPAAELLDAPVATPVGSGY